MRVSFNSHVRGQTRISAVHMRVVLSTLRGPQMDSNFKGEGGGGASAIPA